MISINNLSKYFGKKCALRDVSIEFNNCVYGLIGPNGAGKTTLLRCITLLYPEGENAITYNGKKIDNHNNYLNNIGFLPQQFGLFKELTAGEMLEMIANLKGIPRKQAKREVIRCIEVVNLKSNIDVKIKNLSGGMIRRLGIAQSLLGDPQIIVFDEPTAGLDPEERLRFKNIVAEIKSNKTIIVSTHIVEDVDAICDRIVILNDSKIVCEGTNDNIRSIALNKVYNVKESEMERVHGSHYVFKKYEKNGEIYNRVLAKESQTFNSISPEIEDGYLCAIKEI